MCSLKQGDFMVFSSLLFIFFFLPITLLLYTISPMKIKNLTLLMASLIFYAWGEPVYIFIMIFSAVIDYFHGLFIHKFREKKPWKAKIGLISSLAINIGLLSFFKYADFLIHNINTFLSLDLQPLELPLPIGISFYTFQTMSYTIDVYRGHIEPQRNPITLATYVCLFPQLIAGPIVRYEKIAQQLKKRKVKLADFYAGIQLFVIGLGKKVLIANNIGLLWENVQQLGLEGLTVSSAWLGILAFALQIYFDFSGYSDMAIGLGKMFGFSFPQNFNYPFIARNITEFWRRWHMTLGGWFRDYVYIPLGGNRVSTSRHFLNILIVWSLTGLWHGANWNFMLWGFYFGVILIMEKAFLLAWLKKLPTFLHHLYFIFLLMISWVIFVFEDLTMAQEYFKIMFGLAQRPLLDSQFIYLFYTNIVLLTMAIIGSMPVMPKVTQSIGHLKGFRLFIGPAIYIIIISVVTAYLVDESYNPFLYFRF